MYSLGGDTMAPSGLYARLCHAFLVSIFFSFFSPLGKPADRAIYFTFRNFSETNYLKIRWTDFHNLYME